MRVSGGDRRRGQSRPYSDSIHLPRQEYPGPRSYDAMLRGGQHATHQPLSLPDAGKGSSLYQLNLWTWRYGRGQERKVSILDAGGAGEDCSRGAGEGWREGQAPAAGHY